MKYTYRTRQTCAHQIQFELENGIISNVQFHGGCNGNLKAIERLIEGMPVDELKEKLAGITCGFKSTSCADQLIQAVESALKEN